MKQYLKLEDFPLKMEPIRTQVWQDYDALDALAQRKGYKSIECSDDEHIDESGLRVGMQNRNLHSGWIATMGDSGHVVEDMIALLNKKVEKIRSQGKELIVGFCQTGHFSVGYSIYVKEKTERKPGFLEAYVCEKGGKA